MFFHCICIFWCFGCASLFPVQICNTVTKRLKAIFDCRGKMEEQDSFMTALVDVMNRNKRIGKVYYMSATMIGNKCPKNVYKSYLGGWDFKYNETLPLSPVLENLEEFGKGEDMTPCGFLHISFIFLFNIVDINNQSNPIIKEILDNINDNRAFNIFFIIQTSEKPSHIYSTLDFIHFTASFKHLNATEIFDKICDKNAENDFLAYSGRSSVKSEYRIFNQLSNISAGEAICLCADRCGMRLLSLEFYDEFVDLIQYINSSSIADDTNGINLSLRIGLFSGPFYQSRLASYWESDNPYIFSKPTLVKGEALCFSLNLSKYTDRILFDDKNLYNLGRYLIETDCYEPLQHSLIVCEWDNTTPQLYYGQAKKQSSTVSSSVTLTEDYIRNIFSIFYTKKSLELPCKSDFQITGAFQEYFCFSYIDMKTDNEIKNSNSNFITLLNKRSDSLYFLKDIDISKCELYNECQKTPYNVKVNDISNPNVDIFCAAKQKANDSCSLRMVNLNFTLEYVQCKSNKSQYSLKCVKAYDNQCEDNSNLLNCETFVCPDAFVKCFNSYCIFPEMKGNGERDCPHSEDELNLSQTNKDSNQNGSHADFILNIKDICLHLNSFKDLSPIIVTNAQFVCDKVCPKNYKCVSSKIKENISNTITSKMKQIQFQIRSFVKSKDVVKASEDHESLVNSYLFSIVSFRGRNCRLTNFDYAFQNWRLNNLIGLDISLNKINHSNYLKSVEQLSQLKLLNLSHNDNLIIDPLFNFPISLEIIDLSHTAIYSLRNNIFAKLKNLKHLNLSHTLITRFEHMGLPEYFTLDTFYIQQLRIRRAQRNFFRGLTINYEFMASDYVICCPQILNKNISVDKCHAPVDLISSCKHLVGDTFKRVVIWIVGFLTLVGNGIVLAYRIGWNRDIFKKAYGHFIAGLAISDLFMGVYLIIIAIVDAYHKDVYIIEDFDWRNGIMCNVCGFLSTLSSETSTFFVCLITVDRFLCIACPFGEHTFSKTGKLLSLTLAWFFGVVLALLPVVLSDLEIYSSNGLCLALPLNPIQNKGSIFSFVVFVGLNFVLFLFIALGQMSIFINFRKVKKSISIATQNNQRNSEDLAVAKNLAMVAFTNFCCWFPVGILGFLSLNGYTFNREVYAWIAVFVLPVNSALNPIIYTIPTVYSKCKILFHDKLVALRAEF